MSVMDGKTLELSTDCQTPAEKSSGKTPERTASKDGSLLLTHLLNSSDRGALESAWQSGMNSSDSSSCSSLDENECSMDEFNTTARLVFAVTDLIFRACCELLGLLGC